MGISSEPEALLSGRQWERGKTEMLIAVLAAIEDCSIYETWRDTLKSNRDLEERFGHHTEQISDATRLFGYVSIRRLDDFLWIKKGKPSDLNWRDFQIDRGFVLGERDCLLTTWQRKLVGKAVAHLTEFADLEVEEIEQLDDAVKQSAIILARLKTEVKLAIERFASIEHPADSTASEISI